MGVVYMAEQQQPVRRRVALKITPSTYFNGLDAAGGGGGRGYNFDIFDKLFLSA
jgi:hypothetical protein